MSSDSTRKCLITNNPCGTDTWSEGYVCLCLNCQLYLIENQKQMSSAIQVIVDKHFWELLS